MKKLLLVLTFLVGCSSNPPANPNYPEAETGGAVFCEKACKRMEELSCKLAKPTPDGRTCETVCKKYTPPSPVGWKPECLSKAPSCAEAERCAYLCPGLQGANLLRRDSGSR